MFSDKATEDAIAQSILKKNMTQLMTIIFKDVLGNDNVGDHEKVQNVAHRFTQTFDRVKQDVINAFTKNFTEDIKKTLQKASSNDVTNEVTKDF